MIYKLTNIEFTSKYIPILLSKMDYDNYHGIKYYDLVRRYEPYNGMSYVSVDPNTDDVIGFISHDQYNNRWKIHSFDKGNMTFVLDAYSLFKHNLSTYESASFYLLDKEIDLRWFRTFEKLVKKYDGTITQSRRNGGSLRHMCSFRSIVCNGFENLISDIVSMCGLNIDKKCTHDGVSGYTFKAFFKYDDEENGDTDDREVRNFYICIDRLIKMINDSELTNFVRECNISTYSGTVEFSVNPSEEFYESNYYQRETNGFFKNPENQCFK